MGNEEFISAEDFMKLIMGENEKQTTNSFGEAAKAIYNMYTCLITAGFTETQAFELITRIITSMMPRA